MPAHILVVDDDPDLEVLITHRFRRHIRLGEFRFLFAQNGESALELVRSEPELDMVLAEIDIPGMDGLSFLSHLKALDHKLKAVVISSHTDLANIRSAMNAGAFDCLAKPLDFRDLEVTIRKTLAETALLRRLAGKQRRFQRWRGNLARFFAPSRVEALGSSYEALATAREQMMTLLVADIDDPHALCEKLTGNRAFDLLRDLQSRLKHCVFQHGGMLERRPGTGFTASFGTPVDRRRGATDALRCALALLRMVEPFNEQYDLPPSLRLRPCLGMHRGPVWWGNIGDRQHTELTTLGFTVSLAQHLRDLARRLDTALVISDGLHRTLVDEASQYRPLLEKFLPCPDQSPANHHFMTVHTLSLDQARNLLIRNDLDANSHAREVS